MTGTGHPPVCPSRHGCDRSTLQGVLYHMVHHQALSPKEIADRIGVSYAYLVASADPERRDVQFQARWIVPLTMITGDSALIDYFARGVRRVSYPMPTLDAREPQRSTTERVTKVIGEFGDLLRAITDSTDPDSPSGHAVTDREAFAVQELGARAIAGIAYAVASVQQLAGNHA